MIGMAAAKNRLGNLDPAFGPQLRQLLRDLAIVRDRVEPRQPIVAALQEAEEGVVVLGRDRVELVIVAARTGHRQAEERLRHHVDAVVEAVGLVLANVHGRMDLLAEEPEAGAEDRFVETVLRAEPRKGSG